MTLTSEEIYENIKPRKKKRTIIIVFILTALLTAGAIWVIKAYKSKENVVEYETQRPFVGNVASIVSASGKISATNEVQIGSQVSGTIISVFAEENDRIKKGQVLAIINPETINQNIAKYEAQLGSAKAALASAEAALLNKEWTYLQNKKLYDATGGRSPSVNDLETARMDLAAAEADVTVKKAAIKEAETNLNSEKINLKNSIIVSPIDGVVLKKSIEAGQTVAASFETPNLFTVAENLEKMKLVVNVSEADVGSVREGQKVVFTVDTYPDKVFESTVYRVNIGSTATDDNIVSYETTIYLDNKDLLLRSGMSATADIETARAENVLLAPMAALFFDPAAVPEEDADKNKMFMSPHGAKVAEKELKIDSKTGRLWILKNGVPAAVEVAIGISDGKNTQVSAPDLDTNSLVITGIRSKK